MFFEIFSNFREKRSYMNQESQKINFLIFELKFSMVGPYYVYNKVLPPFFYFSRSYGLGLVHLARFSNSSYQLKFGTFIPYNLYIQYLFHFRDNMAPIDPFPRR